MARLPVIVTKFVKVKWLVGELPVDKKMIVVLKASVSEASIKPFAPF